MIGGSYAAREAAESIGVHNSDLAKFLSGVVPQDGKRVTSADKIAENLISGLRGESPSSLYDSPSSQYLAFWTNKSAELKELADEFSAELNRAKGIVPLPSAGTERSSPPDPKTGSVGKSTGLRDNHIGELCYAEAEWRETNLGPGEGQWLQLKLRFDKSYTLERVRNIALDLHLHRIHVDIQLDGGRAADRNSWIEQGDDNGNKLIIHQGNAWTNERPSYDIDNPTRSTPLSGKYDWFDLCEVTATVGEEALLELSASIGGISISLPPEIRKQLDPDKRDPFDMSEERLIEGWLRNRLIPKSRLVGGGLYQLTQIELKKRPR